MSSMLPAIPPSFGNLKDVFRSAQQSVLGDENVLNLPSVESAIVILVDGLGAKNLMAASSSAPFLISASGRTIYCGFPSTTASSIASFATGTLSSEHGLFGYKIFDRARQQSINLLSGIDKYSVLDYLKVEPISFHERCRVNAVTLAEYADTGFTRATMHNAIHHFSDSIAGRFRIAADLAQSEKSLIYVYVPELDQAAHRFGADSEQWRSLLSELDMSVRKLVEAISENTGLLITSDHGIVDVKHSDHVFLDEILEIRDDFIDVAGDPRVVFLYLRDLAEIERVKRTLTSEMADSVSVVEPHDLIEAGYWTNSILNDDDLVPDLVLLAKADVAVYHRDFAKISSMRMVGQHGSLSDGEVQIPLLGFCAYSSSLLVP